MLKYILLCFIFSTLHAGLYGQGYENVSLDTLDISVNDLHARYRPSRERVIDITHIRLDLTPRFEQKSLSGKAYLDLKAYNRPVSHVELDALGMIIRQVAIAAADSLLPLEYGYDDLAIRITLPREYGREEQFTLLIEYEAFPYELRDKGIEPTSGRGMYFIDPLDKNPFKPVQMWTQGETESNPAWFPVVNAPNEHFTQDIFITVDSSYATLSNGLLVKSEAKPGGMRTDHWSQSKAHGPHLVMVAAGRFHIERDSWGPLEVDYYTTEEYSRDVKLVFGQTPAMMSFFSEILNVDYPWEKYAQMVVYDFTSGAMENTTATIFYDSYFADRFDLVDRNYDDIIAHELIHHWFGNLVACESWAHLALNESFATYGEYLWYDHRYGRETADHLINEYLFIYLGESLYKSEPIVNFYYDDPEALFDAHRYEKGSVVLHMLRGLLGDDFFFQGLEDYLKTFQFQSAEISDLRKSFEKVSGRDLYWFFDQWFMKPGHPEVDIAQVWDKANDRVKLTVNQKQDISRYTTYRFPLAVDVYLKDTVERHRVWVDERTEIIYLDVPTKPFLVNVDAEKTMLWEKHEDKPRDEWIYQYNHAPLYVDRLEAVNGLRYRQNDTKVRETFLKALDDPFWHIRQFVLNSIDPELYHTGEGTVEKLQEMAVRDRSSVVRKAALSALEELGLKYALPVCDSLFHSDSSRMVKAKALAVLYRHDPIKGYRLASAADSLNNIYLATEISGIYADMGDHTRHDFFKRMIWRTRSYWVSVILDDYTAFLKRMDLLTISDAAGFLADVAAHEEDDEIRAVARFALFKLQEYFLRNGKPGDREKAEAIMKVLD